MKRQTAMKRSPLKRKHPMKRRRSVHTTPQREQWRREQTYCHWCGRRLHLPTCQVHEIAGGSARARSIEYATAWLIACGDPCHRAFERLSKPESYALKALLDGENYDRRKLNELHRPQGGTAIETYITAGEVAEALALLVAGQRCKAVQRKLEMVPPEAA